MSIEQSLDGTTFSNEVFYTWTGNNNDELKEYRTITTARYIRIQLAVKDDSGTNGGRLQIDNISVEDFTTNCDDDADGIPNQLDLDSDNDGIPDTIEAQATNANPFISPSGSLGLNGLYTSYGSGLTPVNTDSSNDAIPDYLDTDSDGDGAPDRMEANVSLSGNVGTNGLDNTIDDGDSYADVNGRFDDTPFVADGNISSLNFPNTAVNPSTTEIDWRDPSTQFRDNDNDGMQDSVDLDDDNDGILDTVEGSGDSDGDGIIDAFDLDSDNDGIPDNIEAQSTTGYIALSGVDNEDNGAGLPPGDGVDDNYAGGITPQDTDGDSIADYLDTDSDNDGVLDNTEAGSALSGSYGTNGLDDNYDNGDNYADVNGNFSNSPATNFPDADADAFNGGDLDYRDASFAFDTDGDGINDNVDLDDDNDGILDVTEIGDCGVSNSDILNWQGGNNALFTSGQDPTTVNSGVITIGSLDITVERRSNVSSQSSYVIGTENNGSYEFTQKPLLVAQSRHIFTFKAPVKNVGFTIYDLNSDTNQTVDNVKLIITQQDGSEYTLVAADYTTGNGINAVSSNTFQNNNNNGNDLVITSIPVFITKIEIVYSNVGSGSTTNDINLFQRLAIGNFSYCAPLDTDNDGVFDYIDLDADNDGIPDNIEAQTTLGYIAPTVVLMETGSIRPTHLAVLESLL
jgi:hypothetical protein